VDEKAPGVGNAGTQMQPEEKSPKSSKRDKRELLGNPEKCRGGPDGTIAPHQGTEFQWLATTEAGMAPMATTTIRGSNKVLIKQQQRIGKKSPIDLPESGGEACTNP